jgi:hypothetical protein
MLRKLYHYSFASSSRALSLLDRVEGCLFCQAPKVSPKQRDYDVLPLHLRGDANSTYEEANGFRHRLGTSWSTGCNQRCGGGL